MSDSFFMMGAIAQVQASPVVKLHRLLKWSMIESKLVGLYQREQSRGGGQEPYSPLSMFKLVLLGQWHGLSDAALEAALKV